MTKKFLFAIFTLAFFLILPTHIFASSGGGLSGGFDQAGEVAKNSGYSATNGSGKDALYATISSVITLVLSLLGVVFFLLIFYGGILWMTAAGDGAKVTKAKGIFETAIVGLIIVLMAYAISVFVISKLSAGLIQGMNESHDYNSDTSSYVPAP